jgi:hypothetical protein
MAWKLIQVKLKSAQLLEGERAWAVGDFRAAVLAFDAARREGAQQQRPWHQALITERAACFYLAHGAKHTGHELRSPYQWTGRLPAWLPVRQDLPMPRQPACAHRIHHLLELPDRLFSWSVPSSAFLPSDLCH